MTDRPFCPDQRARDCFDRWRALVHASGVSMSEADHYVLGVAANATARLTEVAETRARTKDSSERVRLLKLERDCALEMHRVIDMVSRTFGVDVEEQAVEAASTATGTDNVVAFPPRLRSRTAQRIIEVLDLSSKPLTMPGLRRKVPGSETAFRGALRECLRIGAVRRRGLGRKGNPYLYARGE